MVLPVASVVAGVGAAIEIALDSIDTIASQTGGQYVSLTDSGTEAFRSREVPDSSFGGSAEGQSFAGMQTQARTTFTETIEAIKADLELYAQELRRCAETHRDNDARLQHELQTFGESIDVSELATTQVFNDSVEGADVDLAGIDVSGGAMPEDWGPIETNEGTNEGGPRPGGSSTGPQIY